MNWITENISKFLLELLQSFVDFVSDSLNALFNFAQTAGESSEVGAACSVTTGIAITLVLLMVLKQIFTVYVMETDGDPDANPLQLLVKASQAIALICCNGYIYSLLSKLSNAFSAEFTSGVELQNVTAAIGQIIGMITTAHVILPIFLFLMLVLVIIMGIKAGIRGAELSLMKILFPIFCVDMITTNRERWDSFLASYCVTFFGYTIQIFCIRMFMVNFSGGTSLSGYVISLAWMFMAMKTPEWLQKYTYTSGLKGVIGGGIRNAAMMVRFNTKS